MVLALLLGISWLLFTLFLTFPRNLDRREGVLLFMIILDLHISASWIFAMELKKVTVSKHVPEYLAYLLHRTVLVPLIAVIFTNLLLFRWSFGMKMCVWLAYGVTLLLLEKLNTAFGVFTFHNWNYIDSMLLYYPYLLVAYYLLKWYRAHMDKEVKIQ